MSAPSPAEVAPQARLLRILGLAFSLAVVIGGTVGTGILRMPGEVAYLLRTPGLVLGIWLAGGIYVLLGTLSVAELGTMLPEAGGFYVYARRALGDGLGRLVGLSDWLGQCAAIAYVAVALGEFSGLLVPRLAGRATAIGLGVIAGFGILHWAGLRASSGAQKWTTAVKALVFGALIAVCFGAPAAVETGPAAPPHGWGLAAAYFLALEAVIVTYDGWYCAIYFTEEDRNPGRNLPRAMLGATAAIIAIYLLINWGFLHVLGADGLAASKQPAADAVARMAGATAGKLVTAISILSLVPLINALLMCSTRILFALSRDRLVPFRALATVNPRGTPVAFIPTVAVAGLLVATGTFSRLVGIASFLYIVNHCSSFVSLLVLRQRAPGAARPFRVPLYPWVPLAALGGGLSYLLGALFSDPANSGIALALVVLLAAAGFRPRMLSRRLS